MSHNAYSTTRSKPNRSVVTASLFAIIAHAGCADDDTTPSPAVDDDSSAVASSGDDSEGSDASEISDPSPSDSALQYVGYVEESDIDENTRIMNATDRLTTTTRTSNAGLFPSNEYATAQFFTTEDLAGDSITTLAFNNEVDTWTAGVLPNDMWNSVRAYNVKPGCTLAIYEHHDWTGHKHEGTQTGQYLIVTSVTNIPNFRSFKIKCPNNNPSRLQLFYYNNYAGPYLEVWDNFAVTDAVAPYIWTTSEGIWSLAINKAGNANRTVKLRPNRSGGDNNTVGVFFESQPSTPSLNTRVQRYDFYSSAPVSCQNHGECYTETSGCEPLSEGRDSNYQSCDFSAQPDGSYCTDYGKCVNPHTGYSSSPGR